MGRNRPAPQFFLRPHGIRKMTRELAYTLRWAGTNCTLIFIKAILVSQTGIMKTFFEAEAVSHSDSTQRQLKIFPYHTDKRASQQPQAGLAPAE